MVHIKSNIAKKGASLIYEIVEVFIPGLGEPVPRFKYSGEGNFDTSAFEGMRQPRTDAKDEATVFLLEALNDGPMLSTDVEEAAQAHGISE